MDLVRTTKREKFTSRNETYLAKRIKTKFRYHLVSRKVKFHETLIKFLLISCFAKPKSMQKWKP
jgi:hypothetical protein